MIAVLADSNYTSFFIICKDIKKLKYNIKKLLRIVLIVKKKRHKQEKSRLRAKLQSDNYNLMYKYKKNPFSGVKIAPKKRRF